VSSERNEENEPENEVEEGLSLEELSQSYANVLAQASPGSATETGVDTSDDNVAEHTEEDDSDADILDFPANDPSDADAGVVNPLSILESILFVGRPDSGSISAAEIARLMRGVDEAEVVELASQLNDIYLETGRAMRVIEAPDGFRTVLADDLADVRERFYGRIREIKLSQSAIDCLALIAYQPGVSRRQLEDQRGQASGGVLNHLVRRELIEVRREKEGKKLSPHYYPTKRLLHLAGLASLDDLPQVEELD